MKNLVLLIMLFCLSISGCQTTKAGKGAGAGIVGGALAGQAIGHNTEGTLVGMALGGLLGYAVGNEMDKYDRQQVNTTYETVPDQQTTTWTNPNTKRHYSATPQRTYRDPATGQDCREVKILGYVDGRPEEIISTACRDTQGQWQQTSQSTVSQSY